jgi:hypothetical protein
MLRMRLRLTPAMTRIGTFYEGIKIKLHSTARKNNTTKKGRGSLLIHGPCVPDVESVASQEDVPGWSFLLSAV